MKNINTPNADSSVIRTLTLGVSLLALVTGCRNRVLSNIESTVGSLEVNCASLLASPDTQIDTIGDSGIQATGGDGSSCGCSEDSIFTECSYRKPSKGGANVPSETHSMVSVAKNGKAIRTNEKNQDGSSVLHIGVADVGGMPVCAQVGDSHVGITAEACEQFGLSISEKIKRVYDSLKKGRE